MIKIKNNDIDEIYIEAIKILIKNKNKSVNDNILYEDSAMFEIDSYISKNRIIISNDGITSNFNYNTFYSAGNKMALLECDYWYDCFFGDDKLNNIIKHLKLFPDSKRAIISHWKDSYLDLSKPSACQVYVYFRRIDDSIEMHCSMRAEDAFNCNLLDLEIMNEIHIFLSNSLNLKKGKFIHFVNSFHLYLKDKEESFNIYNE